MRLHVIKAVYIKGRSHKAEKLAQLLGAVRARHLVDLQTTQVWKSEDSELWGPLNST